jgi:hypothetical protein
LLALWLWLLFGLLHFAQIKGETKRIVQEFSRHRDQVIAQLDKTNSFYQFFLTECLSSYLGVYQAYHTQMSNYLQEIGDRMEEAKAFAAVVCVAWWLVGCRRTDSVFVDLVLRFRSVILF